MNQHRLRNSNDNVKSSWKSKLQK